MSMNPRVTHVEAQDNFTLNVTFRTGERRRFDVTPYLDRGVFRQLKSRSRFRAARVVAGSVEWPGEIDLSYDTLYVEGDDSRVGVVFDPWVGKKYWTSDIFGIRVLVLGESHYGNKRDIRTTFTSDVIRQLAQTHRNSFFTKVAKVLYGFDQRTWLGNGPRAEIWEHVAFYNYVQDLVGDGVRKRPTHRMWTVAAAPFLGILRELKPEVVLVLGESLNRHLPCFPAQTLRAHITHPSSNKFAYDAANPVFAHLVARARRRRQD